MKLKVGFAVERDLANLAALRAIAGAGILAADANQAWSIEQAQELVPQLGEPLRDRFCGPLCDVTDGTAKLGEEPGLGIAADLSLIEQYRTL